MNKQGVIVNGKHTHKHNEREVKSFLHDCLLAYGMMLRQKAKIKRAQHNNNKYNIVAAAA
jgi:hypothetical protein